MKTLNQLLDERHVAYSRACLSDFKNNIEEWREANRAYVAARDMRNTRLEQPGSKANRKAA